LATNKDQEDHGAFVHTIVALRALAVAACSGGDSRFLAADPRSPHGCASW
jgi:hypothetical protein